MNRKMFIEIAESLGWQVNDSDPKYVEMGKSPTYGYDFWETFHITDESTTAEIRQEVWNAYESFDPCEETYLWLDDEGHGKNGAPYHMRDVLEEMEECESYLKELYETVMAQ